MLVDARYEHSELTGLVIEAAMVVHRTLGSGFPEVIYQRALAVEFASKQLPFERELSLPVFYKGVEIGVRRVDFLIQRGVLVELKAVGELTDAHVAQTLNYLKAYQLRVALLINFGETSLTFRRFANSKGNLFLP